MAEPFKNMFNYKALEVFASDIEVIYKGFDKEGFLELVFDDGFEGLELKERMRHITFQLGKTLDKSYEENIDILREASRDKSGFIYMVLPDYVEVYGLGSFEKSVEALRDFTSACSSEFAVRPFIIRYGKDMMDEVMKWTESDSEHIRRLASEGTRPILPWAMDIPRFRQDPSEVIPILDKLKDDESAYVRKSVANNLNSISKDHPEVTLKIAKDWYGIEKKRDLMIKHGLRTILKSSDERALKLLGYHNPKDIKVENFEIDKKVLMGDYLEFSFDIKSQGDLGKLRLEYIMDFVRLRNKRSQKVFKISEGEFKGSSKRVVKKHSFRPVTTRKYYEGLHRVTLLINGVEFAKGEFDLIGE